MKLSWPACELIQGSSKAAYKKKQKSLSMNGHTAMLERIRHDTLDGLHAAMMKFEKACSQPPGLFKADIDAAFRYACLFLSVDVCAILVIAFPCCSELNSFSCRRVPVHAEHAWAMGVAFRLADGQVVWRFLLSCCNACCFHLHCARVFFLHMNMLLALCASRMVIVSQHAACPFGATSSVLAWERVGALITHVIRK